MPSGDLRLDANVIQPKTKKASSNMNSLAPVRVKGDKLVASETIKVRLVRRWYCADDTMAFEFVANDGQELPAFTAGSHVDVHLPRKMVRQYSLWNDPTERHRYCLGVLRDWTGRGGSIAMHAMKVGDVLEFGSPRNAFELIEDASHYLLLAGGIGITPILSMAARLASANKPFELHYCGRTASRMAFREELTQGPFRDKVHLHFDDGPTDQKLDLANLLSRRRDDARLYACGPAGFLDAVSSNARAAWPDEAVHQERFAIEKPTAGMGDASFKVRLAQDGRSFDVQPGRTIVEVLAEHGVDVPVSCEQGICGTCVTRVVSGLPDHRDHVLTEKQRAAGNVITPCCSRSISEELVLDL